MLIDLWQNHMQMTCSSKKLEKKPLLGTASHHLLLFLFFNFGGLTLDFTGTSKRAVNFSHYVLEKNVSL